MSSRNGPSALEAETLATLNVGGTLFQTTISTLRADDQSKIYDIFGAKNLEKIMRDSEGRFFLDQDPINFRFVLAYLRLIKNLKTRKGALRPNRHSNEPRANFRMYGQNIDVREIWLGEESDPCTADELLEHTLPTKTEDLYGVLYQAEYFGLHHLKSVVAKRLAKGNTTSFLLEDVLEALGGPKGTSPRPRSRVK